MSTHKIILAIFLLCTVIFFYPFFLKGEIPLPGDIILGAYHPWKDLAWGQFSAPYPVKIFEMNDAVNFYYPVKQEIVRQIKKGELPLWNSLILNGTPLVGDGHSGAFYPLNFLLFIGNFNFGWALYIISQPLLAAYFLYLFLRYHRLSIPSSFFGGLSFSFGSYLINQSELANLGHTALWIPLFFLGLDLYRDRRPNARVLIIFSLTMMFLAGFLQFFIYGAILGGIYFLTYKPITFKKIFYGLSLIILFIIFTASALFPFINFLPQTVRWHGFGVEVSITEWLMKPNLLLTLLAPDFFGHPATGNWTGGYAYYEFIAYLGPFLLPLLFLAIRSGHRLKKFFFVSLFISLLLIVRTPLSLAIYGSGLPLLSALTPSRLLIIFIFSAAILIALGIEELTKADKKVKLLAFGLLPSLLILIFLNSGNKHLLLPIFYSLAGFLAITLFHKKNFTQFALIFITFISLFYQGHKYLVFIPPNLVYPDTPVTNYLSNNLGPYRLLSIHPEILPSNANMVYGLPTSNGYHPIHDLQYHLLTSRLQYQAESPQFGKTIFLTRVNPEILDLTRAKYLINLGDITNPEVLSLVKKVFIDGGTIIYEVSTPSGQILEGPSTLYFEQRKWLIIGLMVTSIGTMIIVFSLKIKK